MANRTVTIKPSAGDYTSLATALSTEVASWPNLTTNNGSGGAGILNFEISGTWSSADTGAPNVTGFTTSNTCYVNIYTTGDARHSGIYSTSKYLIKVTNATAFGVDTVNHTHIDGLQIETTGPTGSGRDGFWGGGFTDGANELWISNCIFKGHNHASNTQSIINLGDADNVDARIWNCIIYNVKALASNYGIEIAATSTGTVWVYSCTIIGGAYGLSRASGAVTVKNTYCGGALTADYTGTMTCTTCASSDGVTRTGIAEAVRTLAVSTTQFVNVTATTEDFHLAVGTALIDAGTDTHTDTAPMTFTTDIDNVARGATWDIGADEYVSGATNVVQMII